MTGAPRRASGASRARRLVRRYYLYEVEVFVRRPGRSRPTWSPTPTRSPSRATACAARSSTSPTRRSSRRAGTHSSSRGSTPGGHRPLRAPRPRLQRQRPERARGPPRHLQGVHPPSRRHAPPAVARRAGLTHVHLLPAFDIATVNEDKSQWQEPAGDLSSFPPDSEEAAGGGQGGGRQRRFNWGYDPWHYTVPEGSYATNPDGQPTTSSSDEW